jgi:hypothetical protein
MIISESHQFIFLAIPKTGTSSIEKALGQHASPTTRRFRKHATCARLKRELPPDFWQNALKFAFVRNPYDRMQSWYFYRQRAELADPAHPRHNRYTGNMSFEQFIDSFAKHDWMLNQVAWVAPASLGGEKQLDFVGRFESLERDYREVCERIGIPCTPLPLVRSSGNKSGMSGLWTAHTRRVVNKHFRKDFDYFGYEMLDS